MLKLTTDSHQSHESIREADMSSSLKWGGVGRDPETQRPKLMAYGWGLLYKYLLALLAGMITPFITPVSRAINSGERYLAIYRGYNLTYDKHFFSTLLGAHVVVILRNRRIATNKNPATTGMKSEFR